MTYPHPHGQNPYPGHLQYKAPLVTPHKRYQPYTQSGFSYQNNSRQLYPTTDMFNCTSPAGFDNDPQNYGAPASNSSFMVPKDYSALEASLSYLDNDAYSPTAFPGEVKDVMDLSIKETVDFFVNMKSPIVPWTQSSLDSDKHIESTSISVGNDDGFDLQSRSFQNYYKPNYATTSLLVVSHELASA